MYGRTHTHLSRRLAGVCCYMAMYGRAHTHLSRRLAGVCCYIAMYIPTSVAVSLVYAWLFASVPICWHPAYLRVCPVLTCCRVVRGLPTGCCCGQWTHVCLWGHLPCRWWFVEIVVCRRYVLFNACIAARVHGNSCPYSAVHGYCADLCDIGGL